MRPNRLRTLGGRARQIALTTARALLGEALKRVRPPVAAPPEVERAEYAYYVRYLRPGMTVFDVGANVGEFTLVFSRLVGPSGSVHAFEPAPESFTRLHTVCSAARCSNVALNRAAVTAHDGETTLYVYDDEELSWSSLGRRPLERYGIKVRPPAPESVPALTIDGYCEEARITHIDLLKADVEGAEYQVLLGARRMLEQGRVASIVFEFGTATVDLGSSADEIESYLTKLGYRVRNVVDRDPPFPGRGQAGAVIYSMLIAERA